MIFLIIIFDTGDLMIRFRGSVLRSPTLHLRGEYQMSESLGLFGTFFSEYNRGITR